MTGGALASLVLLVVVLVTDGWVYLDARDQAAHGTPVILSSNVLTIDSPEGWLVACLLLWVLFFPLYLAARNRLA